MQLQKRIDENADIAPAINRAESYDAIDHYIAEIYDRAMTQSDDVALIRSLVGDKPARILEPFCGHGRLLIPLAEAGHEIMGLDLSEQLLQILGERLRRLPAEVQTRAAFRKSDVIADAWPTGFDVVVLGGNCFYELATPAEQEQCVQAASAALVQGGYLYLDNAHMEGDLDPGWCRPGQEEAFPTGVCRDGTQIHGTMETIWYDAPNRLVRFRRTATVETLDGDILEREWTQQKHPPSTAEMSGWLQKHGFVIEKLWGDQHREPYTDESGRAIFWAQKL